MNKINTKTFKYPIPDKIDEYCYDQGKIVSIDKAEIINTWKVIENWKPNQEEGTRDGYVNVSMLYANQPDAELKLKFKGKAVGIAVAAGPDAGMIEYSIDDGPFMELDLFTKWSKQLHLPWYYVLDSELSPKKHMLTIRISKDRNSESQGNACRIKHFFINE